MALAEIAHPSHRDALLAAAVEHGLLQDGRRILLRPTRTTDAPLLQDLFFRMGEDDIRTRFFRHLRSLTDEMAQHLCSVGYDHEMAFAAVIGEREAERVVGTSCYFVDAASGMADVAYMVDPAWQGTGVGSALQERTIAFARQHGVVGLTADVLAENAPMLNVLRRSGLRMESHLDSGAFEVRLYFD